MAVMAERPMFRPWRGSVGVAVPFLLYARYPEADRAAVLKKFVAWSLTTGQSFSRDLGYIALPPEVSSLSLAAVDRIN